MHAAPRLGGESISKRAALPTPDDSLFGDSSMLQSAKPQSRVLKPDAQKASSLQAVPGRTAARPASGMDLSPASTELQSCNVRSNLGEPVASSSLPPGFARSGTPAPNVAAEAPEVQSPMKSAAPLAPQPPSISQRDSLQSSANCASSLRGGAVDDLSLLRRRALESSQRSSGIGQGGKGQKRLRSPAAASRSSSPERHRFRKDPAGRPTSERSSHEYKHDVHRSSSLNRSQSRASRGTEQPALAGQSSRSDVPEPPLRHAASMSHPAERPRAMSAREICKVMPQQPAAHTPAISSIPMANMVPPALAEALPAGPAQQQETVNQAADDNKQQEALNPELEVELELQLQQSNSQMGMPQLGQASSGIGARPASEAGAAADMLPCGQSTAAAASKKTAKIGGGLSFMDMGSMLEKVSSQDKDVKDHKKAKRPKADKLEPQRFVPLTDAAPQLDSVRAAACAAESAQAGSGDSAETAKATHVTAVDVAGPAAPTSPPPNSNIAALLQQIQPFLAPSAGVVPTQHVSKWHTANLSRPPPSPFAQQDDAPPLPAEPPPALAVDLDCEFTPPLPSEPAPPTPDYPPMPPLPPSRPNSAVPSPMPPPCLPPSISQHGSSSASHVDAALPGASTPAMAPTTNIPSISQPGASVPDLPTPAGTASTSLLDNSPDMTLLFAELERHNVLGAGPQPPLPHVPPSDHSITPAAAGQSPAFGSQPAELADASTAQPERLQESIGDAAGARTAATAEKVLKLAHLSTIRRSSGSSNLGSSSANGSWKIGVGEPLRSAQGSSQGCTSLPALPAAPAAAVANQAVPVSKSPPAAAQNSLPAAETPLSEKPLSLSHAEELSDSHLSPRLTEGSEAQASRMVLEESRLPSETPSAKPSTAVAEPQVKSSVTGGLVPSKVLPRVAATSAPASLPCLLVGSKGVTAVSAQKINSASAQAIPAASAAAPPAMPPKPATAAPSTSTAAAQGAAAAAANRTAATAGALKTSSGTSAGATLPSSTSITKRTSSKLVKASSMPLAASKKLSARTANPTASNGVAAEVVAPLPPPPLPKPASLNTANSQGAAIPPRPALPAARTGSVPGAVIPLPPPPPNPPMRGGVKRKKSAPLTCGTPVVVGAGSDSQAGGLQAKVLGGAAEPAAKRPKIGAAAKAAQALQPVASLPLPAAPATPKGRCVIIDNLGAHMTSHTLTLALKALVDGVLHATVASIPLEAGKSYLCGWAAVQFLTPDAALHALQRWQRGLFLSIPACKLARPLLVHWPHWTRAPWGNGRMPGFVGGVETCAHFSQPSSLEFEHSLEWRCLLLQHAAVKRRICSEHATQLAALMHEYSTSAAAAAQEPPPAPLAVVPEEERGPRPASAFLWLKGIPMRGKTEHQVIEEMKLTFEQWTGAPAARLIKDAATNQPTGHALVALSSPEHASFLARDMSEMIFMYAGAPRPLEAKVAVPGPPRGAQAVFGRALQTVFASDIDRAQPGAELIEIGKAKTVEERYAKRLLGLMTRQAAGRVIANQKIVAAREQMQRHHEDVFDKEAFKLIEAYEMRHHIKRIFSSAGRPEPSYKGLPHKLNVCERYMQALHKPQNRVPQRWRQLMDQKYPMQTCI
ncbi:hypothetical protein WJX74_009285 [Apatococcus lobatus]|uniref:RRM domain-containing protein n=1 Tax=Apatococcus lobatus TaxID=904363 RepID=A0AAW1S2G7_9CHLO